MNNLIFHRDFPHNYEVQPLEELPEGRKAFFFPSPRAHAGFGGIIYPPRFADYKLTLSVTPSVRKPWIGKFIPGRGDWNGLSALYSCPNPRHLCVIANGETYVVDTEQPSKELDVDLVCISRVDACLPQGLLILSNQSFISAWGREGLAWESGDFDETNFEKITNVTDDAIYVTTLCGPTLFNFKIDIATGECKKIKQDE